jgi:CheY-like chemotaxis protein
LGVLRKEVFDVVIFDLQMSEMDSFELIERLKKYSVNKNTVIIMLAVAGQRGDASRCRRLNVGAYLIKPVTKKELEGAVSYTLQCRNTGEVDSANPDKDLLVTKHTLRVALAHNGEPLDGVS